MARFVTDGCRVELWGASPDGSAPWLLDWEPITNGDERGARLAIDSARLFCIYDDLQGGGVVFFYGTRLEPGVPMQEEGHGPWEYVNVARLQELGPDEVQAGLADWLGAPSEYCNRVLTWAGMSRRISVMDEAHARRLQGRGPIYLDGPDTLVQEDDS